MEQYKIEANERFFDDLLVVLREGGFWIWEEARITLIKSGGKLIGNRADMIEVKKLVSKKYFNNFFGISQN
jgi:hypothetical protein